MTYCQDVVYHVAAEMYLCGLCLYSQKRSYQMLLRLSRSLGQPINRCEV